MRGKSFDRRAAAQSLGSPATVKVTSVKGFRDVLPDEALQRRRLLEAARAVMERYGYREIEIPMMEKTELFSRSVGATSDIVEKEMYSFEDRDGTSIALRPEGTASVVRAYLQAGMARSHPLAKLYYQGPMFRRERPQKGRYRQFTQVGAELLGRDDPESDAETLCMIADIFEAAGISGIRIELNSLGDHACRPAHRDALTAFGRERSELLCKDCRDRLDRNPLRLLDCKQPGCREAMQDAPVMLDFLCEPCKSHHDRVVEMVALAGVDVVANPRMVRGLDYYCRTAFEVIGTGLGSQDAVGGGGRYDGLIEELGGPAMAGIGFALGIERMQLAAGEPKASGVGIGYYVAPLCADAAVPALKLARRLRAAGERVEVGASGRKIQNYLKRADKESARWTVLIGEHELAEGRVTVRDMVGQRDLAGCFELGAQGEEIVALMKRILES